MILPLIKRSIKFFNFTDSLLNQLSPMIRKCLGREENYDLRMDTVLVRYYLTIHQSLSFDLPMFSNPQSIIIPLIRFIHPYTPLSIHLHVLFIHLLLYLSTQSVNWSRSSILWSTILYISICTIVTSVGIRYNVPC